MGWKARQAVVEGLGAWARGSLPLRDAHAELEEHLRNRGRAADNADDRPLAVHVHGLPHRVVRNIATMEELPARPGGVVPVGDFHGGVAPGMNARERLKADSWQLIADS